MTPMEDQQQQQESEQKIEFDLHKHDIIDTHCHIQEDTDSIEKAVALPFAKSWLMGTTVADWDRVDSLANAFEQQQRGDHVLRCFGIHPWFVYQYHPPKELLGLPITTSLVQVKPKEGEGQLKEAEGEGEEEEESGKCSCTSNDNTTSSNSNSNEIYKIDNTWEEKMKALLEKYPEAMVGEIGVDKVTKVKATGKNEQEAQWLFLSKQIAMAKQYDRLVSLHCVQLHGKLLDFFMALPIDQFPKRIALHTFGGKPSTVSQFSKMKDTKGDRFYFGISFINLTSSRIEKLIQAIPDDRLLLESDQNTPLEAEQSLFRVIQTVSKSKNWSIEATIQKTKLNALRFLSK
ncbi:hypothetical protein CYY_003461 [Polysphondylium violaceum]|uniref:Uncharacterized protein n=1 Tax=Polysphondylium violaceum TaxID=133409 RepID=A0A8J4PUQ4_9MYCE|nr:hypothetical protein CYY_003461 [Polysphondylium violaceum]